jgi:hypothetical protein
MGTAEKHYFRDEECKTFTLLTIRQWSKNMLNCEGTWNNDIIETISFKVLIELEEVVIASAVIFR